MKRLMIYLREYRKESFLAPLFKLLEAFFELLVPLVMAGMIDRGIGKGDVGYVARMGACLLLLGVVGLIAAITAQFFAAKAAVGFATKVRKALFEKIQSLSFTSLDRVGTTTLITRMTSDVNQVQSGVNMVLRLFLRSPIVVFGAMIMAFTIDRKSALVFAVAILLLTIVVFGIMLITMPLYKKVQANVDRMLGITRENLTGVRVLRAFGLEAEEEKRFRTSTGLLASAQTHVGRISAVMNPVTYVIVNGAAILLIYHGGLQVQYGNLTQGEVVAILNYMSQILVELVKLANLIVTITKALACADRVAGVLEMTIDSVCAQPMESKASETDYIRFEHVSLTYEGAGAETLTDIDFTVQKGETVGIIGGTGSGKTSLIHVLSGLYPATKGCVYLEGKDIRGMQRPNLCHKIGQVPQKAVLFQGTIRSNLLWGNEQATEEELWKAIETAQAKDVVLSKERGLDAWVDQGGRNFSGGQRQRLTIARALVGNPDILILDDSASALDYATDANLRKALREVGKEKTLIIVSQRASSILQADKILVLDDGELVGVGSHEELLLNCEVYQEIYESQYAGETGKEAAQ